MEHFTWAALTHIHVAYGAAYGNVREVQRIYLKHFLNNVCVKIIICLLLSTITYRETGTFGGNRHRQG
jgi:hypothetical protein